MFSVFRSLLSGDGLQMQDLVHIFVLIFIVVCCNPVHESAHAWAAEKLGDPTGRLKGRISMNPMRHLDPIGAIMLLLFGFGYAKAVPVNIRNFPPKRRKLYFALTAAAGPISNLLLALFFSLCELALLTVSFRSFNPALVEGQAITMFEYWAIVLNFGTAVVDNSLLLIGVYFFYYAMSVNVMLAVFNLIPFPPLDGSRLITAVLPDRIYYKLLGYERYTMIALFALIFLFDRVGFSPIGWLSTKIIVLFHRVLSLPFGLLM